MKKIKRLANDSTSVNPWERALEATLDEEYKHIKNIIESRTNQKCDDDFSDDDEWHFDSDAILSDDDVNEEIGEELLEAYLENLDNETFAEYEDTIDKLEKAPWNEYVKFIREKLIGTKYNYISKLDTKDTAIAMGEEFISRHFDKLDKFTEDIIDERWEDYEYNKGWSDLREWERDKYNEFR